MRVFHGSDTWIEKIDLLKGKTHPDFGRGFYVTKIRGHAHRRAVNIALTNGTTPVITEFEYHEAYPQNMQLSVKRFDELSEEWADFVMMNRNTNIVQPTHSYDIVEGPIADDWVTFQLERYRRGKITMSTLIEKLKYRNEPTHQICFCTSESLWALELVDEDFRFDSEDLYSLIVEAMMTDFQLAETEAARKFYRSDVFAQLSDKTTGLYLKPWQDIYQMLCSKQIKIQ